MATVKTEGPPTKKQKTEKKKEKKNKQKSNYWLVKIPNWVAEEWWDNTKYPNGSQLGKLYVMTDQNKNNQDNKTNTNKKMQFEITDPPILPQPHRQNSMFGMNGNNISRNHNNKNNQLSEFDNIPIPKHFKMEQREQRDRVNVKHGELKVLGKDQLLVFMDKPAFHLGHNVECLDVNARNNHSSISGVNSDDDDEDEDDDIKMKKKGFNKKKGGKGRGGKGNNNTLSSLKGYAKGKVVEINDDDRTFTVEFNKSKKHRYRVPERDIRFQNPDDAHKANKCKILSLVAAEMDVAPHWTKQYQDFCKLRSMKNAAQREIKLKERVNIYEQTMAKRKEEAERRIQNLKKIDRRQVKSNKNKDEKKKVRKEKRVRKDEKLYEKMIFAAFEKNSSLQQNELQKKTGEPWNFLKNVVEKLCNYQSRNEKGRIWVLKPEYRLATDNDINTANDE